MKKEGKLEPLAPTGGHRTFRPSKLVQRDDATAAHEVSVSMLTGKVTSLERQY